MDRGAIHRELEEARASFHQLVAGADEAGLRRLLTAALDGAAR